MTEPELYTEEQVQAIIQQEREASQQQSDTDDRYDNELIKYYRKISKNQSIDHIVDFIKKVHWTDRQAEKLTKYAQVTLGDGVSTTYFQDHFDMAKFRDDKSMMDIDLPLGMTTFDVDENFVLVVDMVNYHVGVASRMSFGGMLLKQMRTQRHEFEHKETEREKNVGIGDKVKNKFGW